MVIKRRASLTENELIENVKLAINPQFPVWVAGSMHLKKGSPAVRAILPTRHRRERLLWDKLGPRRDF